MENEVTKAMICFPRGDTNTESTHGLLVEIIMDDYVLKESDPEKKEMLKYLLGETKVTLFTYVEMVEKATQLSKDLCINIEKFIRNGDDFDENLFVKIRFDFLAYHMLNLFLFCARKDLHIKTQKFFGVCLYNQKQIDMYETVEKELICIAKNFITKFFRTYTKPEQENQNK